MKSIRKYLIYTLSLGLIACAPTESSNNPTSTTPEEAIDISNAVFEKRSANCKDYLNTYGATVKDIQRDTTFIAVIELDEGTDSCVMQSNSIPNHDFNDGNARFASPVSEVEKTMNIPANPQMAETPTELSLMTDNAVMLNGVKLDLLAAACYGVGDERIGCNDMSQPWRFDPMHPDNQFGTDSHNAHTQPDGSYHYHGDPVAMYDLAGQLPSPVIGFAADGFPIFGPFIEDGGRIRRVKSSYQLKSGERPDESGSPGGTYDGRFRDDFEYVANSGDLDECNGMTRDGVYGYYVTETYPHVLACFKGSPDASFNKTMNGAGGPPPRRFGEPPRNGAPPPRP